MTDHLIAAVRQSLTEWEALGYSNEAVMAGLASYGRVLVEEPMWRAAEISHLASGDLVRGVCCGDSTSPGIGVVFRIGQVGTDWVISADGHHSLCGACTEIEVCR